MRKLGNNSVACVRRRMKRRSWRCLHGRVSSVWINYDWLVAEYGMCFARERTGCLSWQLSWKGRKDNDTGHKAEHSLMSVVHSQSPKRLRATTVSKYDSHCRFEVNVTLQRQPNVSGRGPPCYASA